MTLLYRCMLSSLLLIPIIALAGCGPDLSLLNGNQALYITHFTVRSNRAYAVGIDVGQHKALLLDWTSHGWMRDPQPPPVGQGDSLTSATIASDGTLWVGGLLSDAAHGENTQVKGFVQHRLIDGNWKRDEFSSGINALAFNAPDDGWAVGIGGSIFHFDGTRWTQFPNDMQYDLHAIAFRTPGDGWITGDGGVIMHFDGANWQHIPHLTHEALYDLTITPDDGWIVGSNGVVFHLNGGQWVGYTAPINTTNRAVAIIQNTLYIIGDNGAVFTHPLDGFGWQHLTPPANIQLNAITSDPDGTIWIGANSDQRVIYQLAKWSWQAITI